MKCIDEEIPFEIPEGWEWCRIGNIIKLISGQDFPPERYNDNAIGIPYITGASNILNNNLVINRWTSTPSVIATTGDLLMVCKGSGVGKMCKVKIQQCHIARQIQSIRDEFKVLNLTYIEFFLLSSLNDIVSKTQGVIPGISRDVIQNLLFPVPPLMEQEQIVLKIEYILPILEKYSISQEKLDKLNIEINDKLRKSILQEAIQGKLVPQIAEEGTAQELLEQIKEEKQKLVKAGKLKKSALTDSVIYKSDDNKYYERIGKSVIDITDQIPFEIPNNWCWCRLSNVISLLSGRDLTPEQYNSNQNGIPYMTGASNFNAGNLIVNRWTNFPITISHKNDLLITCKGTIGELAFNLIGDIHIARQIMSLSGIVIELGYIRWFLCAIISSLEKQANSMIPGISRDTLLETLLPLPPKDEQKRIVTSINELLNLLN